MEIIIIEELEKYEYQCWSVVYYKNLMGAIECLNSNSLQLYSLKLIKVLTTKLSSFHCNP